MQTDFQRVGAFHERFGLDHVKTTPFDSFAASPRPGSTPGAGPRVLPADVVEFRAAFMQEELDEFRAAVADGDPAKQFDALLDLVYVAMGTAHLMGFPWPEGMAEVQRANMTKVRAAGAEDPRSKRGHALDVVKPEHWRAPDIRSILEAFGW